MYMFLVGRRHDLQAFESGLLKRFAIHRVRNLDQRVGTLPHVLAPQLCDAMLRDDVMDVRTGRDHASAL